MEKKQIIKLSIVFGVIIVIMLTAFIYATFAIDTNTNLGSNNDVDYSYTFDLFDNENKQVKVSSNTTKVLDFVLKNTSNGTISYGITYSSSSDLTNVNVAKLDTSKNNTTGTITKDTSLTVTIVIENNSTNDVVINLNAITGYENGGTLPIINGYTLITNEYSFDT